MNRTTRLKKPQIPELDTLYQFDDLGGRPKYGGVEMTSETDIPSFQEIMDETHSAVVAEATARDDADDALQAQIDSLDSDLAAETTAREAADQAEATARAAADQAETTARTSADNNLQTQIDAIVASSDVKDIVGTYAELQAYDTSTLGDNDIIKVLQDETHQNETTYYRWVLADEEFSLIGEEGPYYTKAATDALLNNKADKATTYTKTETDAALALKADKATTYTKTETDTLLGGKQDTLTAGTNIQINNNTISATDTTYTAGTNVSISSGNVISAADTTYSDFTGTDGTSAGAHGLVPAPTTTDAGKYLKADGTWEEVQAGPTVVQTKGTSTTSVMSQKAVTDLLFYDNNVDKIRIGSTNTSGIQNIKIGSNATTSNIGFDVAIGHNAHATGGHSIAIGAPNTNSLKTLASGSTSIAIGIGAKASGSNSLAFGGYSQADSLASGNFSIAMPYSQATSNGQFDISTSKNPNSVGYNSSDYRLLTGLYDPQNAHDAATKGYVDGKVLSNAGAPTTSTVGTIGQLYEDTTNGKLYQCTDATNPYVWSEVGAGGGSSNVTILTADDYDYPANNPNSLALWNLDTGFYMIDPNSSGIFKASFGFYDTRNMSKGESFVIVKNKHPDANWSNFYQNNKWINFWGTGAGINTGNYFDTDANFLTRKSVKDDLTSTKTDLPLSAKQGKELNDKIEGRIITNAGAPTTSTVGTVGQLLEDTTNGKLYQCTDATNPYVWEEVGAGGGSSVNVVQTTGTSTTDVMSQNATTSMVFADPSGKTKIRIGNGYTSATGLNSVAVGANAKGANNSAVALGYGADAGASSSVAIGRGAKTTTAGEFNIGSSDNWGYNNTNYRLLTGLYDPQSAHDAATKGYVDGLVGNIAAALNAINNGGGN